MRVPSITIHPGSRTCCGVMTIARRSNAGPLAAAGIVTLLAR
jgi:hypothetical protein